MMNMSYDIIMGLRHICNAWSSLEAVARLNDDVICMYLMGGMLSEWKDILSL
jgi:hypothetical protein